MAIPPAIGDLYVHCGHDQGMQFHWISVSADTSLECGTSTKIYPKWVVLCVECYKQYAEEPQECPLAYSATLVDTPKLQKPS